MQAEQQKDKQTNKWIDRQTDGQIDEHTDKHMLGTSKSGPSFADGWWPIIVRQKGVERRSRISILIKSRADSNSNSNGSARKLNNIKSVKTGPTDACLARSSHDGTVSHRSHCWKDPHPESSASVHPCCPMSLSHDMLIVLGFGQVETRRKEPSTSNGRFNATKRPEVNTQINESKSLCKFCA